MRPRSASRSHGAPAAAALLTVILVALLTGCLTGCVPGARTTAPVAAAATSTPAATQAVAATQVAPAAPPEPVRVPLVKGRAEERAIERLQEVGFRVKVVRVSGSAPDGTVVAQKPSGGRAARGSVVTISVVGGSGGSGDTGSGGGGGETASDSGGGSGGAVDAAYRSHASGVQVAGSGTVTRVLSDDTSGSRHQRFILRLASGLTVLVAHNIDIAPRVPGLAAGDSVAFYGVYEWSSQGGTVHWTHHDPDGSHVSGWLKHDGVTYR